MPHSWTESEGQRRPKERLQLKKDQLYSFCLKYPTPTFPQILNYITISLKASYKPVQEIDIDNTQTVNSIVFAD